MENKTLPPLDLDTRLLVGKKRSTDGNSMLASGLDSDNESINFRTAPSSPLKMNPFPGPNLSPFPGPNPSPFPRPGIARSIGDVSSEYTDDIVATPSQTPIPPQVNWTSPGPRPFMMPRPPHPLREIEYPVLQSPMNVSLDGSWDLPIRTKSAFSTGSVKSRGSSHGGPSPLVLVPVVKATPAANMISEASAVAIWVAVEITAKLAAPTSADAFLMEAPLDQQLCIGKRRRHEGQDGWYGCLYNLNVNFVSTEGTWIQEILEHAPKRSLASGQSVLYLVKVICRPRPDYQPASRSMRGCNTTEDFFNNVEMFLGNLTREYLQVHLSYNHTGFPEQAESDPVNGVKMSTKLETVARLTIRIGGKESIWTKPVGEGEEAMLSLQEIVEGYDWTEDDKRNALNRVGEGIAYLPGCSSIQPTYCSDVPELDESSASISAMLHLDGAHVPLRPSLLQALPRSDDEEEEEIQLPPVSPGKLKLVSICPLRRVRVPREANTRKATPMPIARPVIRGAKTPLCVSGVSASPERDWPTKTEEKEVKQRTPRQQRSWFFF